MFQRLIDYLLYLIAGFVGLAGVLFVLLAPAPTTPTETYLLTGIGFVSLMGVAMGTISLLYYHKIKPFLDQRRNNDE